MNQEKKYIKMEELCYRLNSEISKDLFTVKKIKILCKKGLIPFHDLRAYGTKKPRYFFIFDEVKQHLSVK